MTPSSQRPITIKHSSTQKWSSLALMLLSIGLILFGVVNLFFVQSPLLQTPQDLRQDASVTTGQVEVTTAYQAPLVSDPKASITFKANTHGVQTDGVQLTFNVITTSFDTPAITILPESGMHAASQEVERVSDGFLVSFIAVPKAPATTFSSNTARSFAVLEFTPTTSGNVKLAFDRENSISTIHNTTPPEDDLQHIADQTYTITLASVPAPTATPSATPDNRDDLFFTAAANDQYFKFYDLNNQALDFHTLKPGNEYKVKLTFLLNSRLKGPSTDQRSIYSSLLVNNQQNKVTKATTPYSEIVTHNDGVYVVNEQTFIAQELSTFTLTVDSENTISERDEQNNHQTYNYLFTGVGGTSIKSCNESCSSNSECGVNHRCYENKCRLVTNVSSSTCSAATSSGLQRSCNEYCADSRECKSGYSCWNNRCRQPNNVESTSCAAPSASVQQAIVQSCNQTCGSNRDCAVNLRCYQGACRLATNPSSTSCSSATEPVISDVYYRQKGDDSLIENDIASRSATSSAVGITSPRPVASPAVKPSITPLPSPTTTPNFLSRFGIDMSWPMVALVVGLGLLVLMILWSIISRMSRRSQTPPTTPRSAPTTQYEQQLQDKIKNLQQTPPTDASPTRMVNSAMITPPVAPTSAPVVEPTVERESFTPPPSTLRPIAPMVTPPMPSRPAPMPVSPQMAQRPAPVPPRPAPTIRPPQSMVSRPPLAQPPVMAPRPPATAPFKATPPLVSSAPTKPSSLSQSKDFLAELQKRHAPPQAAAPMARPSMPAAKPVFKPQAPAAAKPLTPQPPRVQAVTPTAATPASTAPAAPFRSSMLARIKQKGIVPPQVK